MFAPASMRRMASLCCPAAGFDEQRMPIAKVDVNVCSMAKQDGQGRLQNVQPVGQPHERTKSKARVLDVNVVDAAAEQEVGEVEAAVSHSRNEGRHGILAAFAKIFAGSWIPFEDVLGEFVVSVAQGEMKRVHAVKGTKYSKMSHS